MSCLSISRRTSLFILSLFCFLFFSGCSSLLYYPAQHQFYDPKKSGHTPDEVWFQSGDGTKLFAWHFISKKTPKKGVVLFFHGNAENLSSHFLSLMWILDHGYDFLIFDYRGYGRSEGTPNPQGTVEDGIAALRLIQSKYPTTPQYVYAQSLGGAIALRSIIDIKNELPNLKLVTIDSSFLSYEAVGADVLSRHWVTWLFQPLAYFLLSDDYAPKRVIQDLSPIPLLVVHGDKDSTIPFRFGQDLFAKALNPKYFWTIPEGQHADLFWRTDVDYRVRYLELLKQIR